MFKGESKLTMNVGGGNHGLAMSIKVMISLTNLVHADSAQQTVNGFQKATKVVEDVGSINYGRMLASSTLSGPGEALFPEVVCGSVISINGGKCIILYTAVEAKDVQGCLSPKFADCQDQITEVDAVCNVAVVSMDAMQLGIGCIASLSGADAVGKIGIHHALEVDEMWVLRPTGLMVQTLMVAAPMVGLQGIGNSDKHASGPHGLGPLVLMRSEHTKAVQKGSFKALPFDVMCMMSSGKPSVLFAFAMFIVVFIMVVLLVDD